MKTFKTQREIYQALLDGKKIANRTGNEKSPVVYLKQDGNLNEPWSFSYPEAWLIKCEQHEPREHGSVCVCKHCGVRLKMVWVEV